MGFAKSGGGLRSKYVFQKDGSRFKVLYSKVLTPVDIIDRIYNQRPGSNTILPETKLNPQLLVEYIKRNKKRSYLSWLSYALLYG